MHGNNLIEFVINLALSFLGWIVHCLRQIDTEKFTPKNFIVGTFLTIIAAYIIAETLSVFDVNEGLIRVACTLTGVVGGQFILDTFGKSAKKRIEKEAGKFEKGENKKD
ncbi:hypothetical protein AGMMS50284_0800 [Clostridia bacterium]|nr:hypothetical protein AGMMS50284_0800 [Clostridia bacterium]